MTTLLGLVQVAILLAIALATAGAQSPSNEPSDNTPFVRDVRNKVFERQALLEAYEEFGIDEHACQNEFEILGM